LEYNFPFIILFGTALPSIFWHAPTICDLLNVTIFLFSIMYLSLEEWCLLGCYAVWPL
jgi:hypothetical protein